MIITINQNQIEQAIKNYVNSKMVIAEDQRLDIDLRATRGAEGYTAVIEVVDADAPRTVSAEIEAPQTTIRETVRQARTEPAVKPAPTLVKKTVAPVASTTQITEADIDADNVVDETPMTEVLGDLEEELDGIEPTEPVAKPKSIFSRHTKINNDAYAVSEA
jgi:hypothetical protein